LFLLVSVKDDTTGAVIETMLEPRTDMVPFNWVETPDPDGGWQIANGKISAVAASPFHRE